MKKEKIRIEQALEKGKQLPYAMIRSLSKVELGNTPESVDLEELLEARFFDKSQEVRIFRKEQGLQAALIKADSGEEDCFVETYTLANQSLFGKELRVCYHLAYDEDGQAYVEVGRLVGWKGESENEGRE